MTQNEIDYALIIKLLDILSVNGQPSDEVRKEFIERCLHAAKVNADARNGLGLGIAYCLVGAAMAMKGYPPYKFPE